MLRLLKHEFRIALLRLIRYPMESLGSVIILYLLFLAIFAGSEYVTVGGIGLLGREPAHKLLGFLFYFATISGLSGVPGILEDEAKTGTITNVFTGKYAPWIVLCMKSVVSLVLGLAYVALLWAISLIVIRVVAPVDGRSLCIVLLTYIGMVGIGLCFGGLTLVFKKVGSLLNIVNLGFFVLSIYPNVPSVITRLVPFTQGLALLRTGVSNGSASISEFSALFGISFGYFIGGILFFNRLAVVAKAKGSIGVY